MQQVEISPPREPKRRLRRRATWVRLVERRSLLRYTARAFLSPWQVVGLSFAGLITLVSPTLGVFIVIPFVELGLLLGLPRVGAWRRYVDRTDGREVFLARREEREKLLARVSPAHRAELERLERLAHVACRRVGTTNDGGYPMRAFDGLFAQYLRAAAAHNECEQHIELGDAGRTVPRLSGGSLPFATERVRRRAGNRVAMERLADQLGTLAALIELAYERMITPRPLDDLDESAEEFLGELEHAEETASSFAALRSDELQNRWRAARVGELRADPNWSEP